MDRLAGGRSLTASAGLATALAACAVLVAGRRSAGAAARLRAVLPAPPGRPRGRGVPLPPLPPTTRRWVPRVAGLVAAALVVAGQDGVGVPLAVGIVALSVPERRRAARAERVAAQLSRDLPRAADLLATCLEAGAAPADAMLLVGDVVGGPVRVELLPLAAALRAGVDPVQAWAAAGDREGRPDDPVRRLGRAFTRAAATGAPLADTVAAVAQDERDRARWAAEAAARRAGVRAVGPLGLCFLPAFVLLGVVPVVAGVAGQVLGGLG